MKHLQYPEKYYKTRKGKMYIVINEAKLNGLEKDFDGVSLEGSRKMFRENFIASGVDRVLKEPTETTKGGLLWTSNEKTPKGGQLDFAEIARLANKAKSEAAKKEWGVWSAQLIQAVLYARIPKEGTTSKEDEKKPTMKELIKQANEAEEIRKGKRLTKQKDILSEAAEEGDIEAESTLEQINEEEAGLSEEEIEETEDVSEDEEDASEELIATTDENGLKVTYTDKEGNEIDLAASEREYPAGDY